MKRDYPGLERITYEGALQKAWDDILERDIIELAEHSVSKTSERIITVRFFDKECTVDLRRRIIEQDQKPLEPFLSILILHYLRGCSELHPTGEIITFREIPGGDLYYAAFKSRAIDPLVRKFGNEPEMLLTAAERIGAKRIKMGSTGVRVDVFAKLPVTVVVWKGDEEIPSSANILFDRIAASILPTEDLAVIGSLVASKLTKAV
ncbi:MAG: DUF3786 domain-containing protein [Methanomassiliicoccales archaeon]|jgi:hypothetical protein|nr:DUF3786 domain-containing protein [Methanomassiliicoccales archaeon]